MKPEEIAQINFMNWVKFHLPHIAMDTHHIANERQCTPQEGQKLKRMGVTKGVADIFVAVPIHGKAGLWIELKVGRNKPTQEQMEFLERKLERGYAASCVYGWEAARDRLLSYLQGI